MRLDVKTAQHPELKALVNTSRRATSQSVFLGVYSICKPSMIFLPFPLYLSPILPFPKFHYIYLLYSPLTSFLLVPIRFVL